MAQCAPAVPNCSVQAEQVSATDVCVEGQSLLVVLSFCRETYRLAYVNAGRLCSAQLDAAILSGMHGPSGFFARVRSHPFGLGRVDPTDVLHTRRAEWMIWTRPRVVYFKMETVQGRDRVYRFGCIERMLAFLSLSASAVAAAPLPVAAAPLVEVGATATSSS